MERLLIDLADEAFQALWDLEGKVWANGLAVDLEGIHNAMSAAAQLKECAYLMPSHVGDEDEPLTISDFLRDMDVVPSRKSLTEFSREVADEYRAQHGEAPDTYKGAFSYTKADRPLMETVWDRMREAE